MQKLLIFLFLSFVAVSTVIGQQPKNDTKLAQDGLQQNDTLLYRVLEQINVYPKKGKGINFREYARMVVKIRKVYPFAKDAARELEKYNSLYANSKSDRERKKYLNKIEKELFAKYEDQLKRFTISEGRYLMLLIDRETNNTSYSIIKEVKGSFSASFWQGVAKLFKNDLKEEYDPIYKHYIIEQIVQMIDAEELAKKNKK